MSPNRHHLKRVVGPNESKRWRIKLQRQAGPEGWLQDTRLSPLCRTAFSTVTSTPFNFLTYEREQRTGGMKNTQPRPLNHFPYA